MLSATDARQSAARRLGDGRGGTASRPAARRNPSSPDGRPRLCSWPSPSADPARAATSRGFPLAVCSVDDRTCGARPRALTPCRGGDLAPGRAGPCFSLGPTGAMRRSSAGDGSGCSDCIPGPDNSAWPPPASLRRGPAGSGPGFCHWTRLTQGAPARFLPEEHTPGGTNLATTLLRATRPEQALADSRHAGRPQTRGPLPSRPRPYPAHRPPKGGRDADGTLFDLLTLARPKHTGSARARFAHRLRRPADLVQRRATPGDLRAVRCGWAGHAVFEYLRPGSIAWGTLSTFFLSQREAWGGTHARGRSAPGLAAGPPGKRHDVAGGKARRASCNRFSPSGYARFRALRFFFFLSLRYPCFKTTPHAIPAEGGDKGFTQGEESTSSLTLDGTSGRAPSTDALKPAGEHTTWLRRGPGKTPRQAMIP